MSLGRWLAVLCLGAACIVFAARAVQEGTPEADPRQRWAALLASAGAGLAAAAYVFFPLLTWPGFAAFLAGFAWSAALDKARRS